MNAPTSFGGMTLQADKLGGLPGIRHVFFTRVGGVSEGIYATLNAGVGSNDAQDRVAENRGRMAAALGCPAGNLLSLYQIHSPNVVVADKAWPADARPRADGIVTQIPGLAIAASTADCGPVLLADADARVIGAAHAGWRGALAGVVEATIAAMERLGAARSRIHAAIGPMIRQPNYEVGADLVAQFVSADAANARFFVPAARPGHAMFDLAGYVMSRLERAGVGVCEDLGLCTYADPARFYSFRRTTHRGEPDYGRHLNAIVLANR
jgi:YfiH family protein